MADEGFGDGENEEQMVIQEVKSVFGAGLNGDDEKVK